MAINNTYQNKMLLLLIAWLSLLGFAKGQMNIYNSVEAIYLPYNSIIGIRFSASIEKQINNSFFSFRPHLIYAIGNRNFKFNADNKYALVDGANRSDYPLPGIIPGFNQFPFIKAFNLKTAKTVDVGLSASYGRSIFKFRKNELKASFGFNLSWVEEVSILYTFEGNLSNILGTVNNVHLTAPFSQKYFDFGPKFGLEYNFNIYKNASLGFTSGITWLLHSGFNYGLGPSFRIKI